MENYRLSIQGKNKQGKKSWSIEVGVEPNNFQLFKWQYRAGAGAGAEIMDTRGAKKEPEPRINNFSSATLKILEKSQFCLPLAN